MFCRYCGKQVEDGSAFCSHCGKSLSNKQLFEQPSSTNINPPEHKQTSNAYSSSSSSNSNNKGIVIVVAIILIAVLLCVIFASNSNNSNNDVKTTTTTTPPNNSCVHTYSNATCTEPQKCTKCGVTKGSALGHTTSTGVCSRCNQNFGKWEVGYYVDEFDNPTNQKYITNKDLIVGTFSNSATNDSLLYAKILVDNLDGVRVSIILYEYGRNQVKASYEQNYTITLLDTNQTKHNLKGIMYENGDRVRLYVSYGGYDYISMFIDSMLETGTISLYMVESKYVKSEYLFSIDTSNFAELYYELINGNSSGNNSNNSSNNNNNANTRQLDFELTEDGDSYRVVGIGTYTSENLVIPEEYNGKPVTEIGENAFFGQSFTSVTIPDSVTVIGQWAFAECLSLTDVTIGKGVSNIDGYAFVYSTSLKNINVSQSNYYYKSIDGNLYSKDGTTLIAYAPGKTNSSFTIPDNVVNVYDCAFWEARSLTSVTLGDGVSSITGNAFWDCASLKNINVSADNLYYKSIEGNLYSKDGKTLIKYAIGKTNTSFSIPNTVTIIGDYAFERAMSLKNIEIPNSVISIGEMSFNWCQSLESIIIPNGVTNIGFYSFSDCSALKKVTIPSSVTSIEEGAFYFCTSLTSIEFQGTKTQWNAIVKDEEFGWDWATGDYTIYCTNGTIAKEQE